MSLLFTAFHSSSVEQGKPQVSLIADDQQQYDLRFEPGVVPATVLALLNRTAQAEATAQRQTIVQPLPLRSVVELAFEDGSYGLRLNLDAGLALPVHLTPSTIAILKGALASIEALYAAPDPNSPKQ